MRDVTAAAPRALEHELVGPPGAPVVLVLGGISASRHVADDGGWWAELAGPSRAIDTRERRVLGVEFADGGRTAEGTPASVVTTHDQAAAIVALLDALDVQRLHAVIGASYGGMVALALAERWAARVERAVVICAAHESYAPSIALRAIQRRIVELGLRTGEATEAMALARALAMTTYRTPEELEARFGTSHQLGAASATFEVERYLVHAGEKFAARMPPERFLALSLSADLHRVVPERVLVPTTVVACEGDTLVPAFQTDALARRLARLARHVVLHSDAGHDAFLVEPERLSPILTSALDD